MKTASKLFSVALITLLSLAGCSIPSSPPPPPKVGRVSVETLSHAVIFHDGMTRMSPLEQDQLGAFLLHIPVSAVSNVGLAANDGSLSAMSRSRSVRDFLVKEGIDKKLVLFYPTSELDARTVMVTVQYAKGVTPQNCPDWSKNAAYNYEVTDDSNFGCAYNNNMMVQMANPGDYNGRHVAHAIDASRDSVVLGRYLSDSPQPSSSGGGGASSSSSSGGAGGGSSSSTSSP